MNILDLIQETGLEPRRKAATKGGEFESPCPFCQEGTNRFTMWPNERNRNGDYRGGRYWCRRCNSSGDAITFLREFHSFSYFEACQKLKIKSNLQIASASKLQLQPSFLRIEDPSKIWQEKATSFIEWSHEQMMKNPNAQSEIMARGFSPDSIIRYKLGFNPGRYGKDFFKERLEWGLKEQNEKDAIPRKLWLPIGFTIPTISPGGAILKVKIRRLKWHVNDKLPKYVEVSGSKLSPSIYGDITLKVAVILESELDAILIQQEAGDIAFCIALGGVKKNLMKISTFFLKKHSCFCFA